MLGQDCFNEIPIVPRCLADLQESSHLSWLKHGAFLAVGVIQVGGPGTLCAGVTKLVGSPISKMVCVSLMGIEDKFQTNLRLQTQETALFKTHQMG